MGRRCHHRLTCLFIKSKNIIEMKLTRAASPRIAEISTSHMRGNLVAINQLTIPTGVLAAQLTNMLISMRKVLKQI